MKQIVGLIPAAGSGKRLYPFAGAVPKEMFPVLGKAVIEHCVENLKEGGVKKIFMVVGHKKGALMDYIGDGSFFGVNIAYIYQLERKGLGHAILQGEDWINTPFAVLLGDSFIEPKEEIKGLVKLHQEENPIATILVFEVKDPSAYGIVRFRHLDGNAGEIEKLVEKPSAEQAADYKIDGDYYAITGAYIFEPEIFEYIKKTKPGAKGEIQITDAISLALRSGEKVWGMVLKGKYIDIGKWETALKFERDLLNRTNLDSHIKERERMAKKMGCLKLD
jgi:dTDP-glucose pyrophosphorylase